MSRNSDKPLNSNRDPTLIQHEFLSPNELPTIGTLVAIDAEFVSMQQVCHAVKNYQPRLST